MCYLPHSCAEKVVSRDNLKLDKHQTKSSEACLESLYKVKGAPKTVEGKRKIAPETESVDKNADIRPFELRRG
jgi:hypothetical protein